MLKYWGLPGERGYPRASCWDSVLDQYRFGAAWPVSVNASEAASGTTRQTWLGWMWAPVSLDMALSKYSSRSSKAGGENMTFDFAIG